MNAPTIPTMRSPTIPSPVPCTIWPASHPAMRPTPNMIRRLSFDMCIFVFSRRRCHVHPVLLVNSPGYSKPGCLNFNTLVVGVGRDGAGNVNDAMGRYDSAIADYTK